MSEDVLKTIIQKLEDHEGRISALEGVPIKRTQIQAKKLSIKEFLLTKKPADAVQRTRVIGYYLEHFESMDSFNIKDLAAGFRSAKERPPTNINDKVNMNIRKGLMMETEDKKDNTKAWVLTNSGEKFVEEELPKVNEDD